MRVSEFDFDLPERLIALRPHVPREEARLMRLTSDLNIHHEHIKNLVDFAQENDLFVINDTRVIEAQLSGQRLRGSLKAKVEITLIKNLSEGNWQAFIKPGRKVAPHDLLRFKSDDNLNCVLQATVITKDDDGVFTLDFQETTLGILQKLPLLGQMPLPPYIRSKRKEDDQDRIDYQTFFADQIGSVAAPTAGLHFTNDLVAAIKAKGADFVKVTLHVGAGTFLPVKTENLNSHKMHFEWGMISKETANLINEARKKGGRIICIGTTSLRLLESACDSQGYISPFCAETDIFIRPGTPIRSVDYLMTNFHLPKSTLFILVCALSGSEAMKAAYAEAIHKQYRFFSYGDACLLPNRSRL